MDTLTPTRKFSPGIGLLCIVAVIFWVIAFIGPYKKVHIKFTGMQAQGTVIKKDYGSGGNFFPTVSYTAENGQTYTKFFYDGYHAISIGDHLPILYDKNNPDQSAIDNWVVYASMVFFIILLILGCVFLWAGVRVYNRS